MLQVYHIMLHEDIILNVIDVQLETPGHGYLLLDGQVDKMRYNLVEVRSLRGSFDGDIVGLVGLDGFLVDVGAPGVATVSHPDLLEGEVAAVEFVHDLDGGLEGYWHVVELEGPVRFQHEHQTVRQLFADLNREGPVGPSRGLDGAADVGLGINMLEDDSCSEADLLLHVTG